MRSLIFFTLVTLSLHGWAQPEHYQVYALKFANTGFAMPISIWVDHGPQNDSVDVDFSFWLIRGDRGRNVLVDAGFLRDLVDSPDGKEFAITNYHRLRLTKAGSKRMTTTTSSAQRGKRGLITADSISAMCAVSSSSTWRAG